ERDAAGAPRRTACQTAEHFQPGHSHSPLATWRPYHSTESCVAPGPGVEIFHRQGPAGEADIAPGLFRRHAKAYTAARTRYIWHSVAEAYLAPGASFGVDDEPRRIHIVACQVEHGADLGRRPCRHA